MRQPKGEYGYIRSQRKMYGMLSAISFMVITIVLIVDRYLLEGNVLLLLSVLLVLPAAQFLVKYILYRQFKDGNEIFYKRLEAVSQQLVCLASLAIVRGKQTLFYEAAVMSDRELVLLIDKKKERKDVLSYKEYIEKLIVPKGFSVKVSVYNDEEAMYQYVSDKLVRTLKNVDTNTQVDLAHLLMGQSV